MEWVFGVKCMLLLISDVWKRSVNSFSTEGKLVPVTIRLTCSGSNLRDFDYVFSHFSY